MSERKTIGILGGMGTLATADLLKKIAILTDAACDAEHIRVYIDNNTQIPDRTTAMLKGGADPVPQMLDSVTKLKHCGADCIIMPCNTAHYFLPRLTEHSDMHFISMIERTAQHCKEYFAGKTAALLATTGTIETGVYSQALEAQNVPYILPDDRQKAVLMEVIYDIKGSGNIEKHRQAMEQLISEMKKSGADYFILGCTELPIAASELSLKADFCDPTECLAVAALTYCEYPLKK